MTVNGIDKLVIRVDQVVWISKLVNLLTWSKVLTRYLGGLIVHLW